MQENGVHKRKLLVKTDPHVGSGSARVPSMALLGRPLSPTDRPQESDGPRAGSSANLGASPDTGHRSSTVLGHSHLEADRVCFFPHPNAYSFCF